MRTLPPRAPPRRVAQLAALWALIALGCSSDTGGEPSAGDEPLASGEGSFEALTYNVAGLPEGLSGSHPEVNIPQISPLLNGYDLVLVQEDFAYHEQLVAEAEHPYQSEPKEYHVQLVDDGLNRLSQYPWTTFERVQWVDCYGDASTGASDCLAEKGFSLARTEVGVVTIDVYNHHAEAGGGPEDVAARSAGYEQLIAYIQEHSAGHAVIVAGDTNLHGDDPDDAPLLERFIEETGVTDACAALACGDDRIDRFFYRSSDRVEIEASSWRVADEFVDGDGAPLSDHLAVHVSFAWRTR